MRTRSTAPSEQPDTEQKNLKVPTTAQTPSKTFVLPSAAGDDSRFITLPNPRTGEPNRYFFCPKLGVYEFTVVGSTPQFPRSILFTPKPNTKSSNGEDDRSQAKGTISRVAELYVATPIDVMFFMIPLLAPATSTHTKRLFQPLDDIIDSQDDLASHLRRILYNEDFRSVLQSRVEAVCDSVEAGDEKMFRFDEGKLLKELIAKAERIVAQGLPASLEERFVRQALVTPLMSVKREETIIGGTSSLADDGEGESQDKQETQSTTTTTASVSTPSGVSTPATELSAESNLESATRDNMAHLLRISTVLSFIKESYISPQLCARLDELLATPETPVDLKPLHDHLQHIAELRAQALATQSLGDFSRKRGADDDEAAESRAEKKRRKEEEEKKKKAGESRGVRDLKKVNTAGMKKMSDFFTKAAPKKKS
ncbi:ribonuclease H2 subunit B [Aspergillus udagawae]|uniref:Ribonuclease H2 subunit B n=1 Tax=Aspergillus udagawae TaxID=91492 RepID=A0A8H3RYG6_9EURO|nr:ribonuclease H2 subunit B [Aspergillus udagawae]